MPAFEQNSRGRLPCGVAAAMGVGTGKLGALRTFVTTSSNVPEPRVGEESHRSDELQPNGALQAALYAALRREIPNLVTRWTTQVQPIFSPDLSSTDAGDRLTPASDLAEDLVRVLVTALAAGDEESEAAVVAGLRFGGDAFARGVSLHHTGKAVDCLVAMAMVAMEQAAMLDEQPHGNVAAGIWLSRRVHDRASLLTLAVIQGYARAQEDALRDQFRHLRHDLRNPLGTIKSVLALLDDESVPLEARASPDFRGMAKRNARSLEEMIADRLGDSAVPLPPAASQEIALRTVAAAVLRELDDEAALRGVTVLIQPNELQGRFDATGLELLLRATLHAALQASRREEQLLIEFDATGDDRAVICLSSGSGHALIEQPKVLGRLAALAQTVGANATFSDRVLISVPMRIGNRGARPSAKQPTWRESIGSDARETLHDLRSTREGDHGQASTF